MTCRIHLISVYESICYFFGCLSTYKKSASHFHSFLRYETFRKPAILFVWEHFGSLINDENFAYHSICDTGSQEINKFSLRIVFRKIKRKVSKKYTKYIFRPYFAKIRAKISCLQKLAQSVFRYWNNITLMQKLRKNDRTALTPLVVFINRHEFLGFTRENSPTSHLPVQIQQWKHQN